MSNIPVNENCLTNPAVESDLERALAFASDNAAEKLIKMFDEMFPAKLKIKKLNPRATIPTYGTSGAACFDLYACFNSPANDYSYIHPTTTSLPISTGLAFEVPQDHVMLVFSRSGHGFKNNVRLANCVGVIDSDYRGELMVKLTSDDNDLQDMKVVHGDRIAQAMIIPVNQYEFEVVDELSSTYRGTNGFGSTGK